MKEPLLDPNYWKQRLEFTKQHSRELHQAIFCCGIEHMSKIEEKHRQILKEIINPNDSVLDCGCAYGRLVALMPQDWKGDYLGIDISPDFIEIARTTIRRLNTSFIVGDLLNIDRNICPAGINKYSIAILVSIRGGIRRHTGDNTWLQMESEIKRVAERILYLEYNADDNGSLE